MQSFRTRRSDRKCCEAAEPRINRLADVDLVKDPRRTGTAIRSITPQNLDATKHSLDIAKLKIPDRFSSTHRARQDNMERLHFLSLLILLGLAGQTPCSAQQAGRDGVSQGSRQSTEETGAGVQTANQSDTKQPNVLFIAIDDLRPELGCYGSEIAVSPHLNELAETGLLFNRAYCQQAICRPSRASLMTGARPETTGLFHNYVSLRELQPNIVTLPQHFIANGYETAYCGKIFHHGDEDEAHSWSRDPVKRIKGIEKPKGAFALPENIKARNEDFQRMLSKYGEAARRGLASEPAYESADVPDHAYVDGYNTLLAIETLHEMVEQGDKPFFLAMGFTKPHLNWIAPKKYWDLYDADQIPMALHADAPRDGAAMGLHASFELRTRAGIPKSGPLGPELSRTLKHAYLACVSYVDAQIGKVIAALDDAGVRDNTIIVVWGDHGWHLGDMGVWGKATNYEIATRVPLMIWTPDMKVRGETSDALVELVDIYPTLCELAGISKPSHLEGHSFAPLLDDPHQSWKQAAFSQYPNPALREWAANPLSPAMRETWFGPLIQQVEQRIEKQQGTTWDRELFEQHLMGYTMRTDRYRLVVWKDHRRPDAEPLFVEVYDHHSDPLETENIASKNPGLTAELIEQCNAGWEAAK
ncbi:Choline-sulfatase [Allorhodopirellula heiligendammensis]|uniref:Choline-sulfatase n=2 Tax=Allorhodopirellula heiligendammensis TaxID=2714739 RepID=A0A5C6BSX0_9BACT|nr:Choline-sulfatase [Allorhodopirellula heiligendammensis]